MAENTEKDRHRDAPKPTGARGPYSKGQAKRAQIIDAAIASFERLGYHNCPIAAVARDAGLTLPGLLHHFPSKEHLLVAILEKRNEEQHLAFGMDYHDWKSFLRAFVNVMRDNVCHGGMAGAFTIVKVESLMADHPAARWFNERQDKNRALFASTLQAAQDQGDIKPALQPQAIAYEIMAVMDGLNQQWLRSGQTLDVVTIFEAYIERIIEGYSTFAENG